MSGEAISKGSHGLWNDAIKKGIIPQTTLRLPVARFCANERQLS